MLEEKKDLSHGDSKTPIITGNLIANRAKRYAMVGLKKTAYNKWFQAGIVFILVFVIYLITRVDETPFNHYVLLTDAFFHGHPYLIDAAPHLELARYGDKGFVINPPAPTLFCVPFVAIWGTSFNQTIISIMIGAAAIGLFWVAATQLHWSYSFRVAITFLLALGTNFWWDATDGSVWMMAHVSAVFFLMAALVETTGKNRPWLIGILVGLAGLSRLPTFLSFPFFVYMVGCNAKGWKILLRRVAVFGVILAAMGGLYLLYTYWEYGAFNFGYEQGQFIYESPEFTKGLFDLSYIPRHIEAILFFHPILVEKFPYFKPSYIGMGLFFTTPALIYMFRAHLTKFNIGAVIALLLTLIPIITYGVTGCAQFGYRFSLDVLPFMAILAASGMRYRLDGFKVLVIILCFFVNLWGTLSVNKMGWG